MMIMEVLPSEKCKLVQSRFYRPHHGIVSKVVVAVFVVVATLLYPSSPTYGSATAVVACASAASLHHFYHQPSHNHRHSHHRQATLRQQRSGRKKNASAWEHRRRFLDRIGLRRSHNDAVSYGSYGSFRSSSVSAGCNFSYATSIASIASLIGPHRQNLRFSGWILMATIAIGTIQNIRSSQPIRRAAYFWFHAGPIVFHYKFTRWWLTKTKAPIEKRDEVYNTLHNKYCHKSMDIALHLKGLYVKIAQIVSSRPDFVPPVYIDLFVQAQDSLPQWPIADVSRIIDCTLQSNYNVSIDDVFESIDPVALGSASIGQVHRAKFKDTYLERNIDNGYMGGPFAAIKVMHPGAEDTFRHDFQVFRWLCKVALTGWEPILDECYRQIMSEFDYRREAQSLDTVRRSLSRSPFRKLVHVPEPLRSLCTKELLVMEMLQGKKLSDSFEDELRDALGGDPDVAQSFLRKKRLELILGRENMKKLDLQSVGGIESLGTISKIRLLKLYWRVSKAIDLVVNIQGYQILSVGVFNGDPHPGNLLVLDDGRLGLVDFGQVKEISTEERIGVARIVNDLNTGSTEDIANSMRSLGFQTQNDDDSIIVQYAKLFFDSDADGKVMDCPTPQSYFKKLTDADPLTNVPDVAIFVARSSFILRGMGTLLDKQIETSSLWGKYAKAALSEYDATGDHLTAKTKVGTVTTEPLIAN